jgi:transposase
MIEAFDAQLAPLDTKLRAYARRHPGCKALIAAHYGIGPLVAVTILAELGDCRRFSSSRQAVRYAGIDITVYASDRHRAPGKLSRQGPPALRWALFEAAQCARRRSEAIPTQTPQLGRPTAQVSTRRGLTGPDCTDKDPAS